MTALLVYFLRHTKDPYSFPECRETREKDPDWVNMRGGRLSWGGEIFFC
jgi:hypothetical protein